MAILCRLDSHIASLEEMTDMAKKKVAKKPAKKKAAKKKTSKRCGCGC